jgi:hypothetical protein
MKLKPIGWLTLWSVLQLALAFQQTSEHKDQFYEELMIRPLQDGKIMTHFQFTNKLSLSENFTCKRNSC